MDQLSFGRLWPETAAAVRRHSELLWPLAAAFLFLPQLLFARHVADRRPDQLFKGDALVGDWAIVGLLLIISTLGQLAIARIVHHDGTEGRTLGAELRTALSRLPMAIAVFLILVVLVAFVSMVPLTVVYAAGGAPAAGLLVVPIVGFWLTVRLGVVVPLVATDVPEPVAAIGAAWRLTKGHTLRIAAMMATLLIGFLLLVLAIGGIGAAAGVITALATGPAGSGWGIGRWLFELINAAASAAMGTYYFAWQAVLARSLKQQVRPI